MKNLKTLVLSLILLITILLGVVLLYLNSLQGIKNEETILEKDKKVLTDHLQLLYSTSIEPIDIKNILNLNDTTYTSLAERLNRHSTIILFIPRNYCDPCVLQEILKLKDLPGSIQQNIVCLANFPRLRDLKLFLASKKIKYPAYNISTPMLEEIQKSQSICLFVVDSSLIPNNLFLPITSMPELSDGYYEVINEKYFDYDFSEDKKNKPIVNIEESVKDLGNVRVNDTIFVQFNVKNTSIQPLLINRINTNCGCIVVDWDKKPINKDEEAILRIAFSSNTTGHFSKKISVFSNAESSPNVLIIRGSVIK